jgi:hypothetical protein
MNILESPIFEQVVREPLNKSPLARRRLRGMGCAKGYDTNGATAQGGAVPSTGRCAPEAGRGIRAAARSLLRRAPRVTLWGAPLRRRLTRQTACKAPSHPGCGKIGRSWRCAPWHRSPSYDQRRAPYDHPDFNSNALSEDLFSSSLSVLPIRCNPEISAARKRTAIDRRGR